MPISKRRRPKVRHPQPDGAATCLTSKVRRNRPTRDPDDDVPLAPPQPHDCASTSDAEEGLGRGRGVVGRRIRISNSLLDPRACNGLKTLQGTDNLPKKDIHYIIVTIGTHQRALPGSHTPAPRHYFLPRSSRCKLPTQPQVPKIRCVCARVWYISHRIPCVNP